jgi:hypothetical protein
MTRRRPTSPSSSVRVPAKTQAAARTRYLHFLQLSLSCVSKAVWVTADRPYADGQMSLTCSEDPIRLRPRSSGAMFLTANQYYHYVADPRYEGEWKVSTDGYAYVLRTSEAGRPVFQWHWHPESGLGACHLHVGAEHPEIDALHKLHLPTGRVSLEEVLRFAIEHFDVERRDDWDAVLGESQSRHEMFRTWPTSSRPAQE